MTVTDVAVRDEHATPALFSPTPAEAITNALEQWVGGMAASVRGAEYIVDTPMCPDAFWPLPPDVKSKTPKQRLRGEEEESYLMRRRVATYTLGSVVRYGLQLGLPPEVAVQGIFTVGGRMSMYAEQMVALIKYKGHQHRVIERTRERCTVEVARIGSTDWKSFTYTFDDAVLAGYVPGMGKNASLGNWPDGKPKTAGNEKYLTDPAAMLYARCSSIACRTEFPDVLRGLVTYEEMQDERHVVTATVEDVPPPPRPSPARVAPEAILAAASPAEVPVPEPAPVEVPAAPDPQEPVIERYIMPVSKHQLDELKQRFEELGLGGRAATVRSDRMRILTEIVGRPINDPRELDNDEGRQCIDSLAGQAGVRLVTGVLTPEAVAQEEGDYDPTTEPGWAPMDGATAPGDGA